MTPTERENALIRLEQLDNKGKLTPSEANEYEELEKLIDDYIDYVDDEIFNNWFD